MSAKHYKEAFL
jgi:hypothetical protein